MMYTKKIACEKIYDVTDEKSAIWRLRKCESLCPAFKSVADFKNLTRNNYVNKIVN